LLVHIICLFIFNCLFQDFLTTAATHWADQNLDLCQVSDGVYLETWL
jgi:hypothetical protein